VRIFYFSISSGDGCSRFAALPGINAAFGPRYPPAAGPLWVLMRP